METQIMDSEEGTTFSGLLGGLFWGVADPGLTQLWMDQHQSMDQHLFD